ncbi:MAG: DUF4330 domain-containing protein [Prochlorotrichaceae cyanobacterium]
MSILDSQGRLFGRVSVLDIAAGLIIIVVAIGIFLIPGQGGSVAQVGVTTKPVEIDLWARGLSVKNPETFISTLLAEGKTNIIIRNQPYGEVKILAAEPTPRSVAVPQPDGSLQSLPDPRPELNYTADLLVTIGGDAQITANGPVLGNSKMKIGTPVELEGQTYNFNASVIEVRVL